MRQNYTPLNRSTRAARGDGTWTQGCPSAPCGVIRPRRVIAAAGRPRREPQADCVPSADASGRRTRRSSRLPPNHAPARNPEIPATARGAAGRWRLPGRGRHDRKGGGWSQQGRLGFATGCTRILTDAESILAGILFSGFLQRRKTKSSRDAWRGLMLASSKFSEMPPRPRLEAKARDDDGRPLPLGR